MIDSEVRLLSDFGARLKLLAYLIVSSLVGDSDLITHLLPSLTWGLRY